ncbi:MAG: hypothetical protein KDA27_22970 [Candidatus Eisenbacteria bacterium]|uniref:Uncharacterized protein n=1 Tax=Eiseniibacteriota bacterium TaxID=2212470 RepID=A0A956SGJ3_UNCEI|nr:hypothetical protein [Candidatus Eisenbacteria bacterium]
MFCRAFWDWATSARAGGAGTIILGALSDSRTPPLRPPGWVLIPSDATSVQYMEVVHGDGQSVQPVYSDSVVIVPDTKRWALWLDVHLEIAVLGDFAGVDLPSQPYGTDVEGAIDVMRLAHSSLDLFETRADTLRSSYPRSQAP